VQSDFKGASINIDPMHLGAGKVVSWVVHMANSSISPLRQSLILRWGSNRHSNLTDLAVEAYHLELREGVDDYGNAFVAKELCWTEVRWGVTWWTVNAGCKLDVSLLQSWCASWLG
jgi:hypothetical protein